MKKQIVILLLILSFTSCKQDSDIVASAKIDGKYGFIDQKGEWIISPSFDSVGIFYDGYADYYSNDKNGIINNKGHIIVKADFDFIGIFNDERALILEGDSVNFIDLKGNKISSDGYEDGEDFSNGLAAIQFEKDGKWGYIDKTGKLTIDTIYDYTDEFNDGKAEVELGGLALRIDMKGNITDTIKDSPKSKSYKLIGSSYTGTLGKVNEIGDTIMKPQYIAFGYEQEGMFWYNQENLYGLADSKGNILIQPTFQYLSYFSDNGLALAKLNNKYGYIDKRGNEIIECKFEEAKGFKYDLAAVKIEGKWGFINKRSELVIEPKFEYVSNRFRSFSAKGDPIYNFKRE